MRILRCCRVEAYSILHLGQREIRRPHRGTLQEDDQVAIVAGQNFDSLFLQTLSLAAGLDLSKDKRTRWKGIVGLAVVESIHVPELSAGKYHTRLKDVFALPAPIQRGGNPRDVELRDEDVEKVREVLKALLTYTGGGAGE